MALEVRQGDEYERIYNSAPRDKYLRAVNDTNLSTVSGDCFGKSATESLRTSKTGG